MRGPFGPLSEYSFVLCKSSEGEKRHLTFCNAIVFQIYY